MDGQQGKSEKLKRRFTLWVESYAPEDEEIVPETGRKTHSHYAPAVPEAVLPVDHISTYLSEPLVATATIKQAGSYMQFWHQASSTRLNLAQMASDYCSALVTSVDAERAFLTGRRQVNFTQTNMNSQTFKVQMDVGFWAQTFLYPGFKTVQDIIDKDVDLSQNPFA